MCDGLMNTVLIRDRSLLPAGSALFFLSGGTGLAYQVIWFKRFSQVWGNSSLAMGAVVASFLLGLGVGAHVVGRFSDRSRQPLLWYGVFEVAIGLFAILIPFETRWLPALSTHMYPLLFDQPLLHSVVRSALTVLVIGPPCVLMGGTLPLLVRQFTHADSPLSAWVGWLYGVNTIGAAAGCLVAGFYLLPLWGLFWSNLITAGMNLFIGAIAVVLAVRWIGQSSTPAADSKLEASRPEGADHAVRDSLERPVLYCAVGL